MIRLLVPAVVLVCLAASPALGQTTGPTGYGPDGQANGDDSGGARTHGERARPLLLRGDWAFSMAAGTDNRSKDASKSRGDPFVAAAADWEGDGVTYAGIGFETIDAAGADVQAEAFVGIQPRVAGFDLDLSVTRQWRLGADPGTDADNWEITGSVSRKLGRTDVRLLAQTSPDGAGATGRWTWVEARLGWVLTRTVKATAAIGRREQQDSIDYTGWNAGVSWAVNKHLALDLRWYDTNADPGAADEQYGSTLVAGLSYAF